MHDHVEHIKEKPVSQFKAGDKVRVKDSAYEKELGWDHIEGVVTAKPPPSTTRDGKNVYVKFGNVGPRPNEEIHFPPENLELVGEAPVPRFAVNDVVRLTGEQYKGCNPALRFVVVRVVTGGPFHGVHYHCHNREKPHEKYLFAEDNLMLEVQTTTSSVEKKDERILTRNDNMVLVLDKWLIPQRVEFTMDEKTRTETFQDHTKVSFSDGTSVTVRNGFPVTYNFREPPRIENGLKELVKEGEKEKPQKINVSGVSGGVATDDAAKQIDQIRQAYEALHVRNGPFVSAPYVTSGGNNHMVYQTAAASDGSTVEEKKEEKEKEAQLAARQQLLLDTAYLKGFLWGKLADTWCREVLERVLVALREKE